MNFCKEKNILSEEQLGFMPGNRTSDVHLLLHNLIQDYCHKKGKNYTAVLLILAKRLIPSQEKLFLKN